MRATLALTTSLMIASCANTVTESEPNERVTYNAISFADVTANQAAINELGSKKFSLNNAAAVSMLSSQGSREVLEYLVGCALPAGQAFTVHAAGTTYTFAGDVGLAKSWKSTKLSAKQQRWISACMFARINNQDQLLKISMRGPHHALHVTSAETSRFTQEEGVYYGNLFTGELPIVGWSCRGKAQAQGEGSEGSALSYRDCAEPGFGDTRELGLNQCGWGYAEDCFVHEFGIPFACESKVTTGGGVPDSEADGDASDEPSHGSNAPNAYYRRCHSGGEIPFLEPLWSEVITVYVESGPPSLD
ncbi:MAG: hypothetical protein H0V17_22820 [Deltaproteobacteria bacterium]|nr:hypothetical protein [Deltaproteobacteria bacterium]